VPLDKQQRRVEQLDHSLLQRRRGSGLR